MKKASSLMFHSDALAKLVMDPTVTSLTSEEKDLANQVGKQNRLVTW